VNTVFTDAPARLSPNDIVSTPKTWATLDYRTNEADFFESTVTSTITRAGTVHGLAHWFEATLHEDIRFATPPGDAEVYARTILPLAEPVAVDQGDEIEVTLRVDGRGSRWAWDLAHTPSRGARREFRHATFLGTPIDAATLLRESSTYRPARSSRGERAFHVLERMTGDHSVTDLRDGLAATLAGGSPLRDGVLDEVREIVARYGR
jgi:hypothetical protein